MIVLNYLKNHKFLVFVLFVVIFTIALGVLFTSTFNSDTKPSEVKKPQNQASYKSISPGISTKEEVIDMLGEPKKEEENNSKTRLEYISETLARNHEVITENETVVFIKEIITINENRSTKEITDKYGNTEYILYGQHSAVDIYLYIYPEAGIAYEGDPADGTIIEIWYFEPTTFENFKQTWGKNHSPSPPIQQ